MSDDLDDLLKSARDDRPSRDDEERLERRVVAAIGGGAALSGGHGARTTLLKQIASIAIVGVGLGGAAWLATRGHDTEHDAPSRAHAATPARHDVTPAPVTAIAPPSAIAPSPAAPAVAPSPVPAPAQAPVIAPVPTLASRLHLAPVRATHVDAPVAVAPTEPPPPPAVVTPPSAPEVVPPPAAPPPSEVSLLARARTAMRRGETSAALASVAEHDRLYPAGELSEEIDVLHVEALAAASRGPEARARAAEFERDWPTSLYRERVRRAAGEMR